MADEKHVEILNQGVPVWNRWREENPEIEPDLSGVRLRGKDLSYADFHRCRLRGADFRSAVLIHADFSRSDLMKANLCAADIRYAKFNGANLTAVNLFGTDRSFTVFTGTRLDTSKIVHKRETFFDSLLKMAGEKFILIIVAFIVGGLIMQLFIKACGMAG